MFALVDCNNFYASCERVFNPNLQGLPVAILSNNDGCVIARSDEAKALGLPMGAPAFKYKSFFKANKVQVFSSNYPLYGDMSSRVMKILSQFTPDIEVYSIDEAFLQFKGFDNYKLDAYGHEIRNRVLKWTGIPTCVGIGPTKALSKVANKIARKFPKETGGVYIIDTEEKRIKALKWTSIDKVWGIGRALEKRLIQNQCKTAYDFVQLPDLGYKASKEKSRAQKEAVLFIKQKLDAAKWFIDAIRQRQQTLLLTMSAIMHYQKAYFLSGDEEQLRPMILKDIADEVEMDVSTISRVANSKYVDTPYGTKLIKEFFSESMTNDQGEEVSTREIKSILKTIIVEEDKKKPWTDEKLAKILKEKGYPIARRTVAKYREQLDFPVARLRKQI